MIAQTNPDVQKAVGVLAVLSADERNRLQYEAREKARMDERSRIRGARKEGREEGRVEGREEGLKEKSIAIARNALKENFPVEVIVRLTGLSAEEINRLKG